MKKIYILSILVPFMALLSCQKQEGVVAVASTDIENLDPSPNRISNAPFQTEIIDGKEVSYQSIDGYKVIEGDIIIGTIGDKNSANTRVETNTIMFDNVLKTWSSFSIPYAFASDVKKSKANVLAAIKHWQAKTPFRFVAHDPKKPKEDYILFEAGTDPGACASAMGRVGGKQTIVLATDLCDTGSIIHELGHAMGLWHEQSRGDRDDYVKVLFNNLAPGKAGQFAIRGFYADTEFDFNSIMLYDSYAFTKSPATTPIAKMLPTMLRIVDAYGMPLSKPIPFKTNRSYLSAGDIEGLRTLYGY